MRTNRRFACTAMLMLPAAALARAPELPQFPGTPGSPEACESPALHAALRAQLIRAAEPAGQPPGPARCPRCRCDLFAAPSMPGDIPDLRNLF